MSVMQDWNSRMCRRRALALRAESWSGPDEDKAPPSEAACTSRPAVKARSPAPVRISALME
ncbi:hypothetical protein HMI54_011446 [Coelomomyces lativittatus]|nr:hypothetical protein HMI54_011446 [Coelomomyces lativittatus]